MPIIDKLASSLGSRSDVPNQDLAKLISQTADSSAITELVDLFKTSKSKAIQSDCIKTLYEVSYLAPELVAEHYLLFAETLKSKNNRLVWGAMMALNSISRIQPGSIFPLLTQILTCMDAGSVITKDHGIGVLINLVSFEEYPGMAFPLLMEQLKFCVSKQLPMYAERALFAINESRKKEFTDLLLLRLPEMESESQRKRIEKVVKKLNK
jgi:hypothetical protein